MKFSQDEPAYVKPPADGKAKFFKVPSKSVEGKMYDLRVMPDGEVKCGCPYHVFTSKHCSHITDFINGKQRENNNNTTPAPREEIASSKGAETTQPDSDFPF